MRGSAHHTTQISDVRGSAHQHHLIGAFDAFDGFGGFDGFRQTNIPTDPSQRGGVGLLARSSI